MKKVDMIKLMSALYTNHLDEHGCIIIDLFMEDILKVQIDAGMLPPVALPPDFMHEELAMVNFLTNDLCVWEDEDE